MKPTAQASPAGPTSLLIRFHNQVGAAVDVTGKVHELTSRWVCHGCADGSLSSVGAAVHHVRDIANEHANRCRGSYHHLRT
ncbi:hypothetical protein ACFRR6_31700 [Streptomyces sp. NPDC056891]|uniref:hypothetical protein n=1 Tax=Streptomyces sp. NPDC056891 TaxID=3345961 RepID=UPI00369CEC45